MDNETTEVVAPEGVAESTTAQENVPSTEVKSTETIVETPTETKVETPQNVPTESVKMQNQIDNLNIALKQEREAKKTDADAMKQIQSELANSKEAMDKLKNVFVPEQPTEEAPQGLTLNQLEDFYSKKEEERLEQEQKVTQAEVVKKEVTTLETEWNGENGKPKYDDKEVLSWQESNEKLYLSPKQAFSEMNEEAILDWKVKQRMAQKPNTENVEQPGGGTEERTPQENAPKTDIEIQQAVLDAIDVASNENIN